MCSGPLILSPEANWMSSQSLGRDARGCWQLAAAQVALRELEAVGYSGGSVVSKVV